MRKIAGPSPRELEVFEAYCQHDTAAAAAAALGISPNTVKNQITSLLRKTGSVTTRQLAWKLWAPK